MKNSKDLQTVTKFLSFLKPYWKKGLYALLLMLLTAGLQLPMPFLTKYIIDKVLPTNSFSFLNLLGLVIVVVLLVRAVSGFFQSLLLTVFRGQVLLDIRMKMFGHLLKAPLQFFHQKETGYLTSRLSDDVYAVQGLLAETAVSGIQNILLFVAGIAATLYIHTKLALICFAILPLYLLSLALFNKRIRSLSLQVREQYAKSQSELQELLSAASLIKAFTAESGASLRFFSGIKKVIKSEIKLDVISTLAGLCALLISGAGPVAVLWYGSSEIMKGHLTLGGMMAFMSFTAYLFGPVRIIYDLNLGVQRSLPAVERIFEILETCPEENGAVSLKVFKGNISFEDVNFSYHRSGDEFALKNISFEIESGQMIALAGRSGSGKTSLAMLLLGFYRPDAGRILIDGQDIRTVNLISLRQNIGWVSQGTMLFSGTIADNLRLAKPSAGDDEIKSAATLANAHEFIEQLPQGYSTLVGERGCTLSGGQCQRLAIARALLKDPRILILDEATSQLDSYSEKAIQQALKSIKKRISTLVIAHRLSTIRQADAIVVLEQGRVLEQGTHRGLIRSSSFYRELTAHITSA
jgi:subfamily B ATP-binding cassette protein MsbA